MVVNKMWYTAGALESFRTYLAFLGPYFIDHQKRARVVYRDSIKAPWLRTHDFTLI